MFDRAPEPPAPKPAADFADEIDSDAVAMMKASIEEPKSAAITEPPRKADPPALRQPEPMLREAELSPRKSEPPRTAAPSSRVVKNSEPDDGGENLEFDFNDERTPEMGDEPVEDEPPTSPQRWSVGDEDDAPQPAPPRHSVFGSGELDPEFSRGEPAPIGRGTIPQYAAIAPIEPSEASEPLPDERAFIASTKLHSARSFLGLFLAVAVVFVILTGIMHGIPSASAELMRRVPVIGSEFEQTTPLENLLSVSDVQSTYQTVKGGRAGLVVSGVIKNNSSIAFHTVQIGVRLLDDAQHNLASSAVYCGTTLSPRMIAEMTPHELDFLQKLEPQKAFVLNPGQSAPFLMVFIDPPRDVRHLAVAVAKAQPPASAQTASAGS